MASIAFPQKLTVQHLSRMSRFGSEGNAFGATVSAIAVAIRRIWLHVAPAVQTRRLHIRGVHQSVHRTDRSVLRRLQGLEFILQTLANTALTAILNGAGCRLEPATP